MRKIDVIEFNKVLVEALNGNYKTDKFEVIYYYEPSNFTPRCVLLFDKVPVKAFPNWIFRDIEDQAYYSINAMRTIKDAEPSMHVYLRTFQDMVLTPENLKILQTLIKLSKI